MVKKTTKKKVAKKSSTATAAKKKTKTTKKATTKKTAKPVEEDIVLEQPQQLDNSDQFLHLKVSKTLKEKLITKAKSEGVSLEDFAGELLAEGLVLRAWEIMERKTAMSKSSGNGNSHNSNNSHNNNNKNRYNNNNNNRHKRNNNNNNRRFNNNKNGNFNGNTMDDKANFMEYLRKQEVQQR